MNAPIAVFAFNRPEHLRGTIESLKRCTGFSDSPVYVFADGPRSDSDRPAIEATRSVAHQLLGHCAEMRFSDENLGLSRSILKGVNELLQRYGKVIVVEDDLLLATDFLTFLNAALTFYAKDERILQISGHMYEVFEFYERNESLLLPITTTWGWATWSRAWEAFDPEATGWETLKADQALRHRFNLDGNYDYANMLERQMAGYRQSWGICWYWSVFRAGGMSCFPPQSLVANVGMDGSGTHGRGLFRSFETKKLPKTMISFIPPSTMEFEPQAWLAVKKTVFRQNGGWLGQFIDTVRRVATHWRCNW